VATRSLKRDAFWRIDFKKKGDFRQKIWAVSAFEDFSPKKQMAGSTCVPETLSAAPVHVNPLASILEEPAGSIFGKHISTRWATFKGSFIPTDFL
jgi:hypothetical protein